MKLARLAAVQWLLTHVAPSVAPTRTKKAPYGAGKEPLTWARSEGLEPPTFRSVEIYGRVQYLDSPVLTCRNTRH
jgi:hypothetical protein